MFDSAAERPPGPIFEEESGSTWLRQAAASKKAIREELCDRREAVMEKRFLAHRDFHMRRGEEIAEEMKKKTRTIKLKWTALSYELLFAQPQQEQREQELLAEIDRLQTENAELIEILALKKRARPSKATREAIKRERARLALVEVGSAPVELGEGQAASAAGSSDDLLTV